jgi:hypothetical protein
MKGTYKKWLTGLLASLEDVRLDVLSIKADALVLHNKVIYAKAETFLVFGDIDLLADIYRSLRVFCEWLARYYHDIEVGISHDYLSVNLPTDKLFEGKGPAESDYKLLISKPPDILFKHDPVAYPDDIFNKDQIGIAVRASLSHPSGFAAEFTAHFAIGISFGGAVESYYLAQDVFLTDIQGINLATQDESQDIITTTVRNNLKTIKSVFKDVPRIEGHEVVFLTMVIGDYAGVLGLIRNPLPLPGFGAIIPKRMTDFSAKGDFGLHLMHRATCQILQEQILRYARERVHDKHLEIPSVDVTVDAAHKVFTFIFQIHYSAEACFPRYLFFGPTDCHTYEFRLEATLYGIPQSDPVEGSADLLIQLSLDPNGEHPLGHPIRIRVNRKLNKGHVELDEQFLTYWTSSA